MKKILNRLLAILIAGMLVFPAFAEHEQHDEEEFNPVDNTTIFMVGQWCNNAIYLIQIINFSGQQLLFSTESNSTSARDFNSYSGLGLFFVDQTTGMWTFLTVYEDGMACITASGSNFEPS